MWTFDFRVPWSSELGKPETVTRPWLQGKSPWKVSSSSLFARQRRGEHNYFTEMCSGSEAGSYLGLIDFEYHSTLGLRVIKKRRRGEGTRIIFRVCHYGPCSERVRVCQLKKWRQLKKYPHHLEFVVQLMPRPHLVFAVLGLGFLVLGFGFGVWGLGIGGSVLGFRVSNFVAEMFLGLLVEGLG